MSLLEKTAKKAIRQKYHICAASGTIEEIVGCCYFRDDFHIFFSHQHQNGFENKSICNHFTTKDFINCKVHSPFILPDSIFDKSGIRAGGTLLTDNGLMLFYTGIVKKESETGGVICTEKNIVSVFSEDGFTAKNKNVYLKNGEIDACECTKLSHPKVWKNESGYFMLVGGEGDYGGCAVIFHSENMMSWKLLKKLTSQRKHKARWEYPDAFMLGETEFFIFCEINLANDISPVSDVCAVSTISENSEPVVLPLDFGPDFYAPQSFTDGKGRRILVGLIGSTGENESFDVSFTFPRVLTEKNGRIYQKPHESYEKLRTNRRIVNLERGEKCDTFGTVFEAILTFSESSYCIFLRDSISITSNDGLLTVCYGFEGSVCGKRSFPIQNPDRLHIFSDTSTLEIFADGNCFTTKASDNSEGGLYVADGNCRGEIYKLSGLSYKSER